MAYSLSTVRQIITRVQDNFNWEEEVERAVLRRNRRIIENLLNEMETEQSTRPLPKLYSGVGD